MEGERTEGKALDTLSLRGPSPHSTRAPSRSSTTSSTAHLDGASTRRRTVFSCTRSAFRRATGCAGARASAGPFNEDDKTHVREERREEANEFYAGLVQGPISDDFKQIMRQAIGGMLWTKQYYQFIQKVWLEGDPAQPPPPPERKWIRNKVRVCGQ